MLISVPPHLSPLPQRLQDLAAPQQVLGLLEDRQLEAPQKLKLLAPDIARAVESDMLHLSAACVAPITPQDARTSLGLSVIQE